MNLFRRSCEVPPSAVYLKKAIPFGAGLGGGSADAAFMLKLLREYTSYSVHADKYTMSATHLTDNNKTSETHLTNNNATSATRLTDNTAISATPLTDNELEAMAAEIGADCPFFIRNTPLIASGIGNIFHPITLSLQGYTIYIIKPNVYVSTRDAYAMVNPSKPSASLHDILQRPVHEWKDILINDFESGIFRQYPIIAQCKQYLYDCGAIYAAMSGSGSSVFGLFKNANHHSMPNPQPPSVNRHCVPNEQSPSVDRHCELDPQSLPPNCFIWQCPL